MNLKTFLRTSFGKYSNEIVDYNISLQCYSFPTIRFWENTTKVTDLKSLGQI